MRRVIRNNARIAAGLMLGATVLVAQAAVISPDLERALSLRGTQADTAVIVRLADPLDLAPFIVADRSKRDNRLLVALKLRTAHNRAAVESYLAE